MLLSLQHYGLDLMGILLLWWSYFFIENKISETIHFDLSLCMTLAVILLGDETQWYQLELL